MIEKKEWKKNERKKEGGKEKEVLWELLLLLPLLSLSLSLSCFENHIGPRLHFHYTAHWNTVTLIKEKDWSEPQKGERERRKRNSSFSIYIPCISCLKWIVL